MDRANAIIAAAAEAEEAFRTGNTVANSILIPSGATWKPIDRPQEDKSSTVPQSYHTHDEYLDGEWNDLVNLEHLQLTPQEAFFLIWCFDCLSVLNLQTVCFHAHHDTSPVA